MSLERISLADEACNIILPPFPLIKKLWQRLILDEVTDITNTNLISDDGKNIVRC